MKTLLCLALSAVLAAPAFSADLLVTKTRHRDDRPDKDVVETTWIGKDRMRLETERTVVIVRADLKKVFVLDPKAKTFGTMDLPYDVKKHAPAEIVPLIDGQLAGIKMVVTPTTETKKIKEWNATKYTMTLTTVAPNPPGTVTADIWATKDVAVDSPAWHDMNGALMSYQLSGPDMSAELKKIEGLPVLMERTSTTDRGTRKTTEEVTSVASKDAPEGNYDVPKDYVETKPYILGGGSKGDARPHLAPVSPEPKKDGEKKEGEKPVPPPK